MSRSTITAAAAVTINAVSSRTALVRIQTITAGTRTPTLDVRSGLRTIVLARTTIHAVSNTSKRRPQMTYYLDVEMGS